MFSQFDLPTSGMPHAVKSRGHPSNWVISGNVVWVAASELPRETTLPIHSPIGVRWKSGLDRGGSRSDRGMGSNSMNWKETPDRVMRVSQRREGCDSLSSLPGKDMHLR